VDKLVFRIPAVALLAAGVGLICVTPVAFAVPGMQVLYVLPVAFAVWVLRNRTTVTAESLVARSTFGKRTVAWDDVKAIKLGKSWLSVVLADDKLVRLPAVRMMHLEALAAISGGRITPPTAVPAVEEPDIEEPDPADEDAVVEQEPAEPTPSGEPQAGAPEESAGLTKDRQG
jgi:hypothetical protein